VWRPPACRRKRWRSSWRGRLTQARPCALAVSRRRAGVTAALELSTSFLLRCSCTGWWRWRESPERAWQPPQRSTRVGGSWTQQSCFTLFSQCGYLGSNTCLFSQRGKQSTALKHPPLQEVKGASPVSSRSALTSRRSHPSAPPHGQSAGGQGGTRAARPPSRFAWRHRRPTHPHCR
jgi:hypothetical protein